MSKIAIPPCPSNRKFGVNDTIAITACLPFFRTNRGQYIHRIRYATHHKGNFYTDNGWERHYSHTSFSGWCGAVAFYSSKRHGSSRACVELLAVPPERAVHCAICEAKATGAGMTEAHEICGRFVMFKPRI